MAKPTSSVESRECVIRMDIQNAALANPPMAPEMNQFLVAVEELI
jgi:hypothetical protein